MANGDRPEGARPYGSVLSVNRYVAAGAIAPGDFLKQDSGGKVIVGTATGALCGVAASYAAADGDDVLVYDNPNQKFIVQSDDTDPDAQTDIGLNYDLLATAYDSTYKVSRHELDGSTGATTATLPLKLLGIEVRPDNALGASADCIVKINNHQFGSHTGTAGV